jgi:hypothetical protein
VATSFESNNSLESSSNNSESNTSFEAGVRHVLNALPDAVAVHRVEACFSVLGACLWAVGTVGTNERRDGRESVKRKGEGADGTGEGGQEDDAEEEGKSGGEGRREEVRQPRDVPAPRAWSDEWLPVIARRRMLVLACQVTAVWRDGGGQKGEGKSDAVWQRERATLCGIRPLQSLLPTLASARAHTHTHTHTHIHTHTHAKMKAFLNVMGVHR